MQESLATHLSAFADPLHMIDGFPMPTCKFARAHFTKNFKAHADYGYCATKQEHYYGFKGHVVINSIGVITAATFAKANIDERDVCPESLEKINGLLLGDKGYIRPQLNKDLKEDGIYLQTTLKSNMKDDRPKEFVNWIIITRRLIGTVFGQLAERFNIEKIRARDIWHESSRFWRKLLAHTICIKINIEIGNNPLQLQSLIT